VSELPRLNTKDTEKDTDAAMAIEFDCPYCTTSIRVPDSAGGKRGTCPRCKSKIIVPKVKAGGQKSKGNSAAAGGDTKPKSPAKTQSLKERFLEEPDFSGFEHVPDGDSEAQAERPDAFAAESPHAEPFPTAPVADSEAAPGVDASVEPSPVNPATAVTPVSRALKRRQRRRRALAIWVPIICGVLLVGGAALFMLVLSKQSLKGTLDGVAASQDELKPRKLHPPTVNADDDEVAAVLRRLSIHQRFKRYTVTAVPEEKPTSLLVRVHETRNKRFFRVDLSQSPPLLAFLRKEGDRLDKPRRDEFDTARKRFFKEAVEIVNSGGVLPENRLQQFQNRVLTNLFVGEAGYHLLASVDGTAYPCASQQGDILYYLLPKDTKSFILRGRPMPSGNRMLDAYYLVEVSGTTSQTPKPAPDDQPQTPDDNGGKSDADSPDAEMPNTEESAPGQPDGETMPSPDQPQER